VLAALIKMGHRIELSPILLGDVNGIVVDPDSGVAWGFADSRKGGLALGPAVPVDAEPAR
jgi:gamma-glutamyltranspeptidase